MRQGLDRRTRHRVLGWLLPVFAGQGNDKSRAALCFGASCCGCPCSPGVKLPSPCPVPAALPLQLRPERTRRLRGSDRATRDRGGERPGGHPSASAARCSRETGGTEAAAAVPAAPRAAAGMLRRWQRCRRQSPSGPGAAAGARGSAGLQGLRARHLSRQNRR